MDNTKVKNIPTCRTEFCARGMKLN